MTEITPEHAAYLVRLDAAISRLRVDGLSPEEVYVLPQRSRAERRRRGALMRRLRRLGEVVRRKVDAKEER